MVGGMPTMVVHTNTHITYITAMVGAMPTLDGQRTVVEHRPKQGRNSLAKKEVQQYPYTSPISPHTTTVIPTMQWFMFGYS